MVEAEVMARDERRAAWIPPLGHVHRPIWRGQHVLVGPRAATRDLGCRVDSFVFFSFAKYETVRKICLVSIVSRNTK